MPKALISAILLSALVIPSLAQSKPKSVAVPAPATPAPRASADLPVRRVVLYKNGVGYFEHAGKIRGSQDVNIDFTTGQLNDVLKSLTVVDMSGGQITGVRYNSIAPLSERLRTLRVQLGEDATRAGFLTALRGARVEVRSGGASAVGKLLSVEQIERSVGKDSTEPITQFAIVTDAGEMRTYDLTPAVGVRVLESELTQEIGHYMSAISTSRAKDVRRMTIATNGTGDRDLFVSYISEVPVWKSTYRIMLPSNPNEKALLQGWAIVDNTLGEDWKDVHLSLVAGSPQSFIQPISQPYYVRRPSVELPKSAMLTPQTHEGTIADKMVVLNGAPAAAPTFGTCSLWGIVTDASGAVVAGARVTLRNDISGVSQTTTADASGKYRFNNVPSGNTFLVVEAPGFQRFELSNIFLGAGRTNEISARLTVGTSSQAVEVTAAAPTYDTTTSAMVSRSKVNEFLETMEADAEGQRKGELFEYELRQKITVLKNQSALVPIANARIDAEKIVLWNDEDAQPLRALWIRNTSGLTLDAGTFNIIDGDAFAGEGVLDELYAGERRIISYATDPAVRVVSASEQQNDPKIRVRIAKGVVHVTQEERSATTFKIRNNDTQPRQVIVEHKVQSGWKLADDAKPEESTPNHNRFRVAVGAGESATLKIQEYHPERETIQVSEIDDEQVTLFVRDKAINPVIEQAFRRILAKKNEISGVDSQLASRRREIDDINREQARMRENMKALKGSAEEKALVQRYVGQMNQHEDRLTSLTREIGQLDSSRLKLNAELDQMAQEIVLDEKL